MQIKPDRAAAAASVNHDETPIVELEIEGVDYRIDTGFGSALAISSRACGTWDWAVLAEGRWDGVRLRAKPLDRPLVAVLERALAAAMADRDEAGGA
ncbi:MAG: hypothetical protein HYZ29_01440 [Myxococcales bacterium]|nr:hypothetical protein [Myxococcales bacterium]